MEKLVPRLRFPGFEGEWELRKLGELIEIKSGVSPSNYLIEDNGRYPFVKVEELNNCDKYQAFSRFYSNNKKNLIPKNSIIFPKRGAAILNNKVRINAVDILMDSNMMALIPTNIDSEFLFYKILDEKLYEIADTSTIPQINNKHIEPYKIIIPKKDEQIKISAFLKLFEDRLNLLLKKKTLLEQYKKGMMQQIFSQEVRFKDDDGGDFGEWEEKNLGEIGQSYIGLTYSPDDVVEEDGILVLRSSNIQDGVITFQDNVFVNAEISEKNFVKENDILICARNGSKHLIGKCAIIKKEHEGYAFGAFMTIYRSNYNRFLFHFFKSDFFIKQVHEHLGATINQITTKSLNGFIFPFPPVKEQTKIANFLSAIDDKIALVGKEIAGMENWKKGLLGEMFV
ncbi:hypothetical protein HYN48_07325 [Flavobacterium magnum]|uniref:Type I restriction modification DNA specificity domain-containing protein n=1 Tax=Flavobacterium magnum TaxID=2162713 RepID=A0A2S0RE54_9FLAO|nr:restriction endonuclease subunit S [Flavobacterium magnum]AWA29904.1 hypothetical protein HYN48_07325 [Flavobacterium magnum]